MTPLPSFDKIGEEHVGQYRRFVLRAAEALPRSTEGAGAHAGGRLVWALNTHATPFWIASVAVCVLLGRIRSPRLAWIGGTLLVIGLTALGNEIMTFSVV